MTRETKKFTRDEWRVLCERVDEICGDSVPAMRVRGILGAEMYNRGLVERDVFFEGSVEVTGEIGAPGKSSTDAE